MTNKAGNEIIIFLIKFLCTIDEHISFQVGMKPILK